MNDESVTSWGLLAVMPNLQMKAAFELGTVAIVPSSDPRMAKIRSTNAAARTLLDAIIDTGGRKMPCTAVIGAGSQRVPGRTWEAIIDARNCLAVAVALNGWQHSIGQLNNFLVRYTDYFDFYPRWPNSAGDALCYTGAALGIATTVERRFVAQGHAYILPAGGIISRPEPDESLLKRLVAAWRRVHIKATPRLYDQRLLRSLSLAYEAARVPQTMENPLYDHGKHCSFWVSALETLAHPGSGDATLTTVLDLLQKRPLGDQRVARGRSTRLGRSKQKRHINLPQRLYVRLYNARNRFLHGNRLSIRTFMPRGLAEGVRLLDVAPLIYIVALDAVLGLPPRRIPRSLNASERRVAQIFDIMSHNTLERAFMRAMQSRVPKSERQKAEGT